MRNILLKIAYDGTNFSGWQRQKEQRTVQGELERVLSVLFSGPTEIAGCSRTDAGVHALGQCATLIVPDKGIPTERIPIAANGLLAAGEANGRPGDIAVLSAEEMPEGFHARFSCRGKRYEYRIILPVNRNSTEDLQYLSSESVALAPFMRNYAYFVDKPLNISAMRVAAEHIKGTHDFKCFEAAGGTPRESTVRTIHSLELKLNHPGNLASLDCNHPLQGWPAEEGAAIREGQAGAIPCGILAEGDAMEITIVVEGDGFLYNMVRIIAGTLVDVGLGKIPPESLQSIIESRDRKKAGHTAPPQGLTLAEIYY